MYYYTGEHEPEKDLSITELGVYCVKCIKDYINAKDQLQKLKDLYVKICEEKTEVNDEAVAVSEAITEQEKQMQIFIEGLADYNSDKFSKNLDLLLKANKLKISELESILKVSAGYISRTIGNESKRRLSVDILWKVAELFRVNIDDLLNRDLTAPTRDLRQVVSFVQGLYEDTQSEKIRWENIGTEPNDKNDMFFRLEDGNPYFIPGESPLILCDLRGGYSVDISIGTFYLFEERISSDRNDYSLYLYDKNILEESGGIEDPLVEIAFSASDLSGILEANCKKLVNAIKGHEKDFVISEEARGYMARYLKRRS